MKETRKTYSKRVVKRSSTKRVGVLKASKSKYRFRKVSYANKYIKAISYLHNLEESEIEMMVASSYRVAAAQ